MHAHSREIGRWQQLLCSLSDCYWLGPMQSCLTGFIWDQWQMDNLSWRPGYHQSSRRQVNLVRAPWSSYDAYSVISRFNIAGASAHILNIHPNTHLQTNVVRPNYSHTPWENKSVFLRWGQEPPEWLEGTITHDTYLYLCVTATSLNT